MKCIALKCQFKESKAENQSIKSIFSDHCCNADHVDIQTLPIANKCHFKDSKAENLCIKSFFSDHYFITDHVAGHVCPDLPAASRAEPGLALLARAA